MDKASLVGLTEAAQDYLKTVYRLTQRQELASTNELAQALGIQPASVTSMVQKLSLMDPPLLHYRKRQGVRLTEAGATCALEIIRHHRMIETFLHDFLGYTWDEIHDEAERLEHAISKEMVTRMSELLGDPRFDPHGDPIPDECLRLPARTGQPVSGLVPGEKAIIIRVGDGDADLLRYLGDLGLVPGTALTLIANTPFDDNLHLALTNVEKSVVIGPEISSRIFVLKEHP